MNECWPLVLLISSAPSPISREGERERGRESKYEIPSSAPANNKFLECSEKGIRMINRDMDSAAPRYAMY